MRPVPMRPSFRSAFLGVLIVLAVLVTGFAILDRVQGPKLSTAQVDTTAVASKPAQSLRLFLSERVDTVSRGQVRITPAAPIAVSTSGALVAVQFLQPLRYSTEYHVSLSGVTSSDDAQRSRLDYSFRTASPDIYYLHRSGGAGPDEIIRTGIRGAGQTVVYSAPRIQDYAVFDRALAVVTLDQQGDSSLFFVGDRGVVAPITLPGTGTVDLVRGNHDTGILGFTFTDSGDTTKRRYSSALFTVDPNGTAVPKPVVGLDGKPLSVLDWFFVPSSNYLIAQASDGSVLLLDTTNPRGIIPFGSYLGLDSVSTDGKSAVAADESGPLAVAIPAGSKTRLPTVPVHGNPRTVWGAAQTLPTGWLENESIYDPTVGGFTAPLVFSAGHTARELYTPPDPRGSVGDFAVSPNNEFVALETIPDVAASRDDGYLVNGRSTSVTTVFVDIATGAIVKSVDGFGVSW